MPISIRLPEDIDKRLDFLARQTGRTKAFFILEALTGIIDDLEDYYLAAEVLERICKGEEAAYSSSQVRKELSLYPLIT